MNLLIAIIGSIIAIFSVIILHELGHFVMARIFGIKILRFSIGFGKALWKRKDKNGTEYVFALLPLGGYVKMLGEGEEITTPEEADHAYNKKPVWVRMMVVAAGPIVNMLIAVFAFWGVNLIGVNHIKPVIGRVIPHSIAAKAGLKSGDLLVKVDNAVVYNWQQVMMALVAHIGDKQDMVLTVKPRGASKEQTRVLILSQWKIQQRNPDFFKEIGLFPYQPKIEPVIAKIIPNSPAAMAGLESGDRIMAIADKPINDWAILVQNIQKWPNKRVRVTILRQHHLQNLVLNIGGQKQGNKTIGYAGLLSSPPQLPADLMHKEKYSLLQAWGPAVVQTGTLIKFNFLVLAKMITGKISIHALGGPVTVFQAAGEASLAGFQVYLGFIGFISLTIGFINLLPIPGLDGGHLLFQIIEGIFRRPVPDKIQMVGLSIGMIFLIFLMVQATINDIMRLFLHS